MNTPKIRVRYIHLWFSITDRNPFLRYEDCLFSIDDDYVIIDEDNERNMFLYKEVKRIQIMLPEEELTPYHDPLPHEDF